MNSKAFNDKNSKNLFLFATENFEVIDKLKLDNFENLVYNSFIIKKDYFEYLHLAKWSTNTKIHLPNITSEIS